MSENPNSNTKTALITITRRRPDKSVYRMNYLIKEAEDMETPADIVPIAAEMLADWKQEVAQHPSDPQSPLITFPEQ